MSSYSSSVAAAKSNSSLDLKDALPLLVKEIAELKKELAPQDDELQEELELIDRELSEMTPISDDPNQFNKAQLTRLKKILDRINDPDSLLNQTISASRKGVTACQKLGRLYNLFADSLGMPRIPDILL